MSTDNYMTLINKRTISSLFLGFSSGLPLALVGSTLQGWYTKSGVSIVAIGFLGLVGLPYVYKFLWAPLMDRFVPPLLGRRRGWMLITQLLLVLLICGMAFLSPASHPLLLGGLALLVATMSASQDISIDAYRTEVLRPDERGFGVAMTVSGYRIAMLVSGSVAMMLAGIIGWHETYIIMGLLMLLGVLTSWFAPDPDEELPPPASLYKAVVEPFKNFMTRKSALGLLLFIILYKLGDAFTLSLSTAFLLRGVGFSLATVGFVSKGGGLAATIIGAIIGGMMMSRLGLFRSLLLFGILQAVSNLAYMVLAIVGHNLSLMAFAVFLEHLCGGMGTAAFMAFIMSLCHKRYTATQYALLSALSAVGRVFAGPLSGYLVEQYGWVDFYFFSFVFALPGLMLLWHYRHLIQRDGQSSKPVLSDEDEVLHDN